MHSKLLEAFPNVIASVATVRRARQELGWVSTTPKYCQLIREVNKEKRLNWCNNVLAEEEKFENVIWTDEYSWKHIVNAVTVKRVIQKGKPKHPIKVHLWGGISNRGATPLVIFTGKLCATKLLKIFDAGLFPFVDKSFPNEQPRLMQDNDPKHTSGLATDYLVEKGVYWWKTPPESPDLNPIENVWGSMKRFLRDKHKPRNLASLIEGIHKFWKTLTAECVVGI